MRAEVEYRILLQELKALSKRLKSQNLGELVECANSALDQDLKSNMEAAES